MTPIRSIIICLIQTLNFKALNRIFQNLSPIVNQRILKHDLEFDCNEINENDDFNIDFEKFKP